MAPHSTSKNRIIKKTLDKLNDKIRNLRELGADRLANAEVISLEHVSLGDLKDRWKQRHREVEPILRRQEEHGKFRYLPSDSDRYLIIKGWDDGILLCRAPIRDPQVVQTLTTSMSTLPDERKKKCKPGGLDRGDHSSHFFCIWADSAPEPFISKDTEDHWELAEKFFEDNEKLWKCMSNLLGEIAPATYKQYLRFPLPGKLERFCGAYPGCVVNVGKEGKPVQTKPHRDVKEGKDGYSCLCACGDYQGGELILYELGVVIELRPGDMLLFPDGLIHHANRPVIGTRYSLVAFTRGNMLAYWKKKFGKAKIQGGKILKRSTRK
jgi:hypothetical protein